ncbi:hypothetical protein AAY42_03750 [Flagellimonas eckloniae]|uniref:Lipocalin-like domain-containing protein n=2 Tax=Flagellimonas eckloniae TaxID=346185 RepID=A0A0Q1BWT4_9FLAO|nr:hypothetical protein AAY42_03750 [Allomuricauda eckloniae]
MRKVQLETLLCQSAVVVKLSNYKIALLYNKKWLMNLIKKVPLLVCFVLLLFSCSIDDGEQGIDPPNFDVIGLWDLVEVNVNPAQDINMDGTASTNLIDEMDCISGTLLIDGDLVWTYEQTDIAVSPITNNQYVVTCLESVTATGTWFSDEVEATFDGNSVLTALQIDGELLVNQLGQDLPGIQSYVYERRIVN